MEEFSARFWLNFKPFIKEETSMRRFWKMGVLAVFLSAFATVAGAEQEVWVTNMRSGDVTVFDGRTLKTLSTVPAGRWRPPRLLQQGWQVRPCR